MAKPLDYTPTPPETYPAREELSRLLDNLHESGVLRILSNLLQERHQVSAVALHALEENQGKQGLDNLLILAQALSHLDSDLLHAGMVRITDGLNRGHYNTIVEEKDPGLLGIVKRLGDPDIRRGLNLMLDILAALGGASSAVAHPEANKV